jgi:hypothetical protein
MRQKILLGLTLAITVAVLAAMSLSPTPKVQADNLLQDVPRLDGFNVYFTEENGEASRFDRTDSGLSRFGGLLELLGADTFTLEWRTGIPADADLLVIAGPTKDLNADQIAWLWAFMQNDGRVLLITEPPALAQNAFGSTKDLFQLMWDDMGIRARDDVVVGESGEVQMAVPPAGRVGNGTPTPTPQPAVESPVLFTTFAAGRLNNSHPLIGSFEDPVYFFTARSLEVDSTPRESQVTALAFSPSNFYGEKAFGAYNNTGFVEYNINRDTGYGELVLAAAMENIVTKTRIVLIGDRDFASNGVGFQTSPPYSPSFLYPGNVRFMLKAAAWLLDTDPVDDQIAFPTPGPTATATITPSPEPSPEPASEEGEGS